MAKFGPAAVIFCCLCLIGLGFLYPPEMRDKRNAQGATDTAFGGKGRFTLSQPFSSSMDNLAGFGLAVGNPGGRAFALRVVDASGAVKAQTRSEEQIHGYAEIRFAPVADSAGKRYTLEIAALDEGPRLDFFGGKPDGTGDILLADGVPTQSAIYLQPVARTGMARRGAVLLDRITRRKPWPYSPSGFITLHLMLLAALYGVAACLFHPRAKPVE